MLSKRNLKVDDLFKLTSVTNPKVSPDGKEAVYIQTHIDEEENKYVANLFHVDLETSEVTQWTHGKDGVSSPSWSSDGRQIAFLSNREEKNQVFILPARGGEAKKLTSFEQRRNKFSLVTMREKSMGQCCCRRR